MGQWDDNAAPDIEVRQLSVWYNQSAALQDINLKVAAGQILAVIGPSGCGKSTFLRVLNRMIERFSSVRVKGMVRIGPFNVLDEHVDVTRLRRAVGMVFQHPNPFPMRINSCSKSVNS